MTFFFLAVAIRRSCVSDIKFLAEKKGDMAYEAAHAPPRTLRQAPLDVQSCVLMIGQTGPLLPRHHLLHHRLEIKRNYT